MPPEAGRAQPRLQPLPSEVPDLRTERLHLRALRGSDAQALFGIYGDAEVMRHASEPAFADAAIVEVMLRSVEDLLAQGESLEWAVVERASGQLIGTCGLHGFDADAAKAEVGILLARGAWGRGQAREALSAVLGWAETALGARCLEADIDAANVRSLRLFERLGFRHREGTMHALRLDPTDSAQGLP